MTSTRVRPQNSIESELIELMAYQANRTIAIAAPLFPLMLVPILARHVGWAYPLAWGITMTAGCFGYARFVDYLAKRSTLASDRKLRWVQGAFALCAATISALQAFVPFVPQSVTILINLFVIGCVTSFITPTGGHAGTFLPAMLIVIIPCLLNIVLTPTLEMATPDRLALAGTAAVYAGAMVNYASGVYGVFVSSFEIRQQRDELNARLTAALIDAEAANRAKTRFLASASHDLRQPMHALSLFTGSLQLRPLDPRTSVLASHIDKAVRILGTQLDALLDVSRLDAGIVKPAPEHFMFTSWLAEVAGENAAAVERKGLLLSLDIAPDLHAHTDPILLRRVINNLLSNAVKYTPAGSVHVKARCIGARIEIQISDTGLGIPKAEHSRVFEEFYQLHNSERDRAQGLGLGLAIVRRLSNLLGLNLEMRSEEGTGTIFSFSIASSKAIDVPLEATMLDAGISFKRIRVLVVDDEEIVRDGMQALLEEMQFDVRVADSTEASLQIAASFSPHVVLADLRLRGDDSGIRVIHALQAAACDIRGLLISGDIAPDRLRQAHDVRIPLLHKPVPAAILKQSILQLLSRPATPPDLGSPR